MGEKDIDEIELVLLIGSTNFETIAGLLKQNGYDISEKPVEDEELHEYLYFDTEDRQLYLSGESLRIRLKREGKEKHKMTYKVPIEEPSDEGCMNRREYNVPFKGEPTLENAFTNFQQANPEITLPENLKNVVNVNKLRTAYQLIDQEGNTAEIAFDDMLAIDPENPELQKKLARELEVELITMQPENLERIRQIITDFDPTIRPSKASKYKIALDGIDELRGENIR